MAKASGNYGKMTTPKPRGGKGKPMVTPKPRGDKRAGATPKGRGKGA